MERPKDLVNFLEPTRFIDSDHESIREVVADLDMAQDPLWKRAVKMFRFVRDQIRYNPYSSMFNREDYLASEILARSYGYCVQKAIVLAALSRCAGIPCKLCFADIRNFQVSGNLLEAMGTDIFTYHGYNAFYLDGRWIKATPAFDLEMCEKHGFIPVDFDGKSDAVLHPNDRKGNRHIEYIREIGDDADVPFDDIIAAFKELYLENNPALSGFWKNTPQGDPEPG